MCIVWAKTGAKSNSTRSLVPDERKNVMKMDFTTLNAVTNSLHWTSIKHKPYGSLNRKRNYPSDKCI